MMRWRRVFVPGLLVLLSACVSAPPARTPGRPKPVAVGAGATVPRTSTPPATGGNAAAGTQRPQVKLYAPGTPDGPPGADEIPGNLASIPDAVPRREPLSASGNPPEYEAFGQVYRVLPSAEGFRERGHASWYGKKFQGRATSSGELYDMYAMTAAHKTLPIPSYVRVTNLDNNKSVVVRVNDRGPFHSERVIDLSYTAALKLDLIGHGTAEVEILGLMPDDQTPMLASAAPAAPLPQMSASPPAKTGGKKNAGKPIWLQVASFSEAGNALSLREQLQRQGMRQVSVREALGGRLHRVVVGPFASDGEAQASIDLLHSAGYAAFHLRD